jgi:EmrB/QacA subfamily drug resistance transporter
MRGKWWPLVAVSLGTFMLLIDVTIVNVALPQIADDLDTSFSALQWVVDAYALTLGVLLLGAGTLADLLGHRRFYIGGLALFAVSSLACGLSADSGVLIAARAVQGVGAAAMFTTTFALLNTHYQGRERGVAYGVWGGVSGAAAAVGPVVGGLLTEGVNWRWIFFVNLPISVAAIALSLLVLGPDRERGTGRFDLPGTAAFTVFATALTLAAIRADTVGWGSVQTWGLLVLGAAALAAFLAIELRSSAPMLDLGLLRNRSFAGIVIAALLVNFAAFAALTYTSIWLQSVLGLSPIESGLTGLPLSVLSFAVSAFAGKHLHDRSPRLVIGVGLLIIGAGSLLCGALIDAGASWTALMPGYALLGVGVGVTMPILASSAMSAVPPRRGGMAAGTITTARQLGFAIGIAVLGTVFADRLKQNPTGHGASRAVRTAAASGLHADYLLAGAVGLVAGVLVLILVRTGTGTAHDRPLPTAREAGGVDGDVAIRVEA